MYAVLCPELSYNRCIDHDHDLLVLRNVHTITVHTVTLFRYGVICFGVDFCWSFCSFRTFRNCSISFRAGDGDRDGLSIRVCVMLRAESA